MMLVATLIAASLLAAADVDSKTGQATFKSSEEAVTALKEAVLAKDTAKIKTLFGPQADDLLSGDPVADENDLAALAKAMRQWAQPVAQTAKQSTVFVGAENWPYPIPLVSKGGHWMFDTAAGIDEIRFRNIGKNELTTIATCREFVRAQNEYAALMKAGNGGTPVYAARFISAPGTKDGLYWEAAAGEAESPLGPLVTQATDEGYQKNPEQRQPYHGYFFHILTAQGPAAQGGAKSYLVEGKMTAGFALLAYPALWKSSGVMTFIVGPDGTVYQKNLGAQTEDKAMKIQSFNPGKGWVPVRE